MKDILKEVREISSQKIAEKQKASENGYPKLIEKIKQAAAYGKTECEFEEYAIDQYSKRLLEADGFMCYATTKIMDKRYDHFPRQRESTSIWIVRW